MDFGGSGDFVIYGKVIAIHRKLEGFMNVFNALQYCQKTMQVAGFLSSGQRVTLVVK